MQVTCPNTTCAEFSCRHLQNVLCVTTLHSKNAFPESSFFLTEFTLKRFFIFSFANAVYNFDEKHFPRTKSLRKISGTSWLPSVPSKTSRPHLKMQNIRKELPFIWHGFPCAWQTEKSDNHFHGPMGRIYGSNNIQNRISRPWSYARDTRNSETLAFHRFVLRSINGFFVVSDTMRGWTSTALLHDREIYCLFNSRRKRFSVMLRTQAQRPARTVCKTARLWLDKI